MAEQDSYAKRKLTIQPFVPSTHQGKVIVTRTSARGQEFRMEMSPSEVKKATEIVGIALATSLHDSLPNKLSNTPFVVRIFERQVYALERTDLNFSLPFRAKEGDGLIHNIELALGMCLNEQTQGRAVPCGTTVIQGMAPDEPL